MKRFLALACVTAFVAGCDVIPILSDFFSPEDNTQETGSAKTDPLHLRG